MEEVVAASVVSGFVMFGVGHGRPLPELFAIGELSAADLTDPERMLPVHAIFRLYDHFVATFRDFCVPLRIIEVMDVGRFGLIAQLLRAAATPRHGLELAIRFNRLLAPAVRCTITDDADGSVVTIEHHPEAHKRGGPLETSMGNVLKMMRLTAGAGLAPARVTFGHTTTWPVGPYERFFGGAVQFGAAATTMRFAPGQLDQAIGPGQPELARYLAAHAERLIGDLPPPRASVVTQVRDVLARDLAVGIATQAEVARKLALSGRTLQRRLAEAGTTFQDVLDEVRASAARRLLRDRALAVSEVAFSLGYAELSSFYRAFRRWTGQTPIDWRAAAVS